MKFDLKRKKFHSNNYVLPTKKDNFQKKKKIPYEFLTNILYIIILCYTCSVFISHKITPGVIWSKQKRQPTLKLKSIDNTTVTV